MTKKKKLAIILAAVIMALIAAGAGIFAYASEIAKKNSIGLDSALNIAMSDANAAEENTVVTKAKIDFEKGIFIYDIEFTVDAETEYDYSIKASDGTILEKDRSKADDISLSSETTAELTSALAKTDEGVQQAESNAAGKASDSKETTAAKESENSISLDKAKSIALDNAGVSADKAQSISAHKETDDGITYYDVEFKTSSYKYEYEIDLNGNILEYDRKPVKNNTSAAKTTTAQSAKESAKKTSSGDISTDKAKNIALKNAGLSSDDVTFTKARLEKDDGITYYDVEFKTSSYKYEYEIDLNGNILSSEKESIKKKTSTTKASEASANSQYIGIDKAKEIALNNAGISSSNAKFRKAKLEKDDGVYIYEIEFVVSSTEYEYEINATTGKIVSHSSEPVDD